ncbi:MAG: hypothetical protein WCT26_02595 [Candidatus Buchananbacteria bacterium]
MSEKLKISACFFAIVSAINVGAYAGSIILGIGVLWGLLAIVLAIFSLEK